MFSYTIHDAAGATSTANIFVRVDGQNDAPVANADSNAGDAVIEAGVNPGNTPFAGDPTAAGNVLTNDTDVDPISSRFVSAVNGGSGNVGAAIVGTYGSVVIGSNGALHYTLNNADPDTNALAQGANASDVFNYTVSDEFGATSSTTLTINIIGTNDAAVIGGVTTGDVSEDVAISGGNLSTSGL